MPYDPETHLNCGRAMKSYILRTMVRRCKLTLSNPS